MIVRILGIITGLFFAASSVAMLYGGQEGLISQIGVFVVGSLFTAYGLMGPKRMGRFLPATVNEIGGETLPSESENNEK